MTIKNYKERLLESINSCVRRDAKYLIDSPHYNEHLQGEIKAAILKALSELTTDNDKKQAIAEKVSEETILNWLRHKTASTPVSYYRRLHEYADKLQNIRRQEDRADQWVQIKAVTYTVLKTILIATVILGASYVAKVAEIPLPLRFG